MQSSKHSYLLYIHFEVPWKGLFGSATVQSVTDILLWSFSFKHE